MTMAINRRHFLQSSLVALVGGSSVRNSRLATAGEEKPRANAAELPIIDTHQHLWDLTRFRLPWLRQGTPLGRSHVMADYLEATRGLNVVKAVYMEVDVEPAQQVAEAEYVTAICRQGKTPTVAAVISGRPAAADFRKYISRFRDNRYIKGIRQVLHGGGTPAGFCQGADFIRGLRVLDELGLSFDLCMRSAELGDGVKLVETLPNLRFILDHCGNANVQAKDRTQWQRDMERLARCKNVVCKVSGIVASAPPGKWSADDLAPIVNHTLNVFGPDRVMFGGDWPVCTLAATFRQWVEALKAIVANRPLAEQRKLFHDNAARFYGLG